jgi:nucleoid-associated protein YgaU
MTVTSISRLVVPSLVLLTACGAALVFGTTHVWREPPAATKAATATPSVSPPASGARDEGAHTLANTQAETNAVADVLAISPRSPNTDEAVPAFDIARIERTGDAVIAGSAARGAIVELLRNGEHHDQAVADRSGQFVMVPPRLPPGDYELTLRSRQPDGKLATSKQSVVVALDATESRSSAVRSRAEMPFNAPKTVAANRSVLAVASSPDGGSTSTAVVRKVATAVVSRGDSLWRISQLTYGAGTGYAIVYKANRNQIRNPNRIYPGQIFVLPVKDAEKRR